MPISAGLRGVRPWDVKSDGMAQEIALAFINSDDSSLCKLATSTSFYSFPEIKN